MLWLSGVPAFEQSTRWSFGAAARLELGVELVDEHPLRGGEDRHGAVAGLRLEARHLAGLAVASGRLELLSDVELASDWMIPEGGDHRGLLDTQGEPTQGPVWPKHA